MNELLIAALGFVALLALILVRLSIAAAMAIVGVGGTTWVAGWPAALATLKQGPFERASSYTLVVVPLFLLMGYLASRAGLSQKLFHAANVWLGHRRGGLWAIIATYILLGALMDELAMILLTVPIFFPVVTAVGYDPIWFGVIIVVVVQIGLIAPPVGLNVFVIGGMARDVPLATITAASCRSSRPRSCSWYC